MDSSDYNKLVDSIERAFIQQSSSWSKVIGRFANCSQTFLTVRDDEIVYAGLPLYTTKETPKVTNSVPLYGPLGGICCKSNVELKFKKQIYKDLIYEAQHIAFDVNKACALTIITNPIDLDIELYLGFKKYSPRYIFHNFTQYIEIDKLFISGQFVLSDGDHRKNIASKVRKAREQGLYLHLGLFDIQLKEWYLVHEKRHKEIGATPIPYEFFNRLYFDLGKKSLLYLVYHRDTIIGGLFVVYHREIADAFMLSFDSNYKDMYPNYFVIYHALKDLQKKGVKIFNWQSSQSRDCGVYQFKKQWGSVDSEYCFLTWCPNPKPFLEMGIDEVKKRYAGNYVLPFGAFENPDRQHFYKGE